MGLPNWNLLEGGVFGYSKRVDTLLVYSDIGMDYRSHHILSMGPFSQLGATNLMFEGVLTYSRNA